MGAPSALLKQMHHLDEGVLQAIYGRLSKLAQAASDLQVKLLVDAEHTFYQPVRVCVRVCMYICVHAHAHACSCMWAWAQCVQNPWSFNCPRRHTVEI